MANNVLPRLPANRFDSTPVPYVPYPKFNVMTPQQSSFEDGTLSWANSANATPANVGTTSQDGYRCLSVTSIAAGAMSVNAAGTFAPVTDGNTYACIAYVLAASAPRQCYIQLNWYLNGGGLSGTIVGPTTTDATDGWIALSAVGVAPPTANQSLPIIFFNATGTAGEVHYIDHVFLGPL